jgi:phosphoglycerate kinase
MHLKTLEELDVTGKRVLVRVDFNVSMTDGHIRDDYRLAATLPTITYLRDRRARVILCSHLGRPQGKVVEADRLTPVAQRLGEMLGTPVAFAPDGVGPDAQQAVDALDEGEVLLLENLRFRPGEEANDPEFARSLASLAEIFVNDAFGAVHRAHASIVGITRYLPSVAGLLLEREVAALSLVIQDPSHPFAAVLGGAKVSDKIGVLENLQGQLDLLLIGGGMAATFLNAQGCDVGASPVEEGWIEFARTTMAAAEKSKLRVLVPSDVVVAEEFHADAPHRTVDARSIPTSWCIMDIGPQTLATFRHELQRCKTVVWNGPMGVFEFPAFAQGTKELAEIIASLKEAVTVVGGGSTAEVVTELGVANRMTHVSTGGGASLEFLAGHELPGVAALLRTNQA